MSTLGHLERLRSATSSCGGGYESLRGAVCERRDRLAWSVSGRGPWLNRGTPTLGLVLERS